MMSIARIADPGFLNIPAFTAISNALRVIALTKPIHE